MNFIARFFLLSVFTALATLAFSRWEKHSVWLMAGYFFVAGLIFLV